MNNTTIPSANQSFPAKKILNVTGSHEIIPKLIEAGVDSEKIAVDELDSILIPAEYAPLVYAYCSLPEYVVIEQDCNLKIEQLRVQWKLREINNEIDLIKRNYPEQIARYDIAIKRKDYYLNQVQIPKKIAPKDLFQLRDEMNLHINKNYDRGIIGLRIASIPEVNDEMYGLRGLICLTAAPGCGKTALTVQWMLEALLLDENVCGIFVSLELEPRIIYERIYKLAADMRYRDLRFKSDIDFTANKKKADDVTAKINNRFKIFGEEDCENITIEQLIDMGHVLKESSGCNKIFFVIDYLQLWPTHQIENKKISDIDRDKWIMDKIKKIGKAFPDEPVLIISESRKPVKSGDAWAQGSADISGSARFGYGFEAIMHILPVSDKDIVDIAEGACQLYFEGNKAKEYVSEVRKELKIRGSVLCYIHLSKMRGGEHFKALAEFCYRKDKFTRATGLQSGDVLAIARDRIFRNKKN